MPVRAEGADQLGKARRGERTAVVCLLLFRAGDLGLGIGIGIGIGLELGW